MKTQLRGLALLLFAILLSLAWGNSPVFDLNLRWNVFFVLLGAVGIALTFAPKSKDK